MRIRIVSLNVARSSRGCRELAAVTNTARFRHSVAVEKGTGCLVAN